MDMNTIIICVTVLFSIIIFMSFISVITSRLVNNIITDEILKDSLSSVREIEEELVRITSLEETVSDIQATLHDYSKNMNDLAEIKTKYSHSNIRTAFTPKRN